MSTEVVFGNQSEGLRGAVRWMLMVAQVMERVSGIEPPSHAWEARVIPLYDTRIVS